MILSVEYFRHSLLARISALMLIAVLQFDMLDYVGGEPIAVVSDVPCAECVDTLRDTQHENGGYVCPHRVFNAGRMPVLYPGSEVRISMSLPGGVRKLYDPQTVRCRVARSDHSVFCVYRI